MTARSTTTTASTTPRLSTTLNSCARTTNSATSRRCVTRPCWRSVAYLATGIGAGLCTCPPCPGRVWSSWVMGFSQIRRVFLAGAGELKPDSATNLQMLLLILLNDYRMLRRKTFNSCKLLVPVSSFWPQTPSGSPPLDPAGRLVPCAHPEADATVGDPDSILTWKLTSH